MESLRELYRIGIGPSASHTMGPRRAAEQFRARLPEATSFHVTLYGSLAATGKGHLTDAALQQAFHPYPLTLEWRPDAMLPAHPNGLTMTAWHGDRMVGEWTGYSIGGGAIQEDGTCIPHVHPYELSTMDALIAWTQRTGQPFWQYAEVCEGEGIFAYLREVWDVMQHAVHRGITADGVLPGELRLPRKAASYAAKARLCNQALERTGLVFAYALAVAEANAAGETVVTAPTCGSCGVVPAVLFYLNGLQHVTDDEIVRALATAGIIGNLVKTNASISGAEVGCQGEIGTACAMAAAAIAQLWGGTPRQIEYAAEMGIEHQLGLTCDPVAGLVQIPCIERNAFAAVRALDCAAYALLSDGTHRISFDTVVKTLWETGRDLAPSYRETAQGGLAMLYTPVKGTSCNAS